MYSIRQRCVYRHSCLLTDGKLTRGSGTFEHLEVMEVNSRQHLSLTFDLWCDVTPPTPSRSPLAWPGSLLGKGLRIKGPEMPSRYTISANEHFVMIFVLNWRGFFVLICNILACQHQGEIQGCSPQDSLSFSLVSFSAAALDLFTPPTSSFFISSWAKLSQPCNPLGATSWETYTCACIRRGVCVCVYL